MTDLLGIDAGFKIEVTWIQGLKGYGKSRLWFDSVSVGDFGQSMHLGPMLEAFTTLAGHSVSGLVCFQESATTAPKYDNLLETGGWSFGEAYDEFGLVYYRDLTSEAIHFQWKGNTNCGGRNASPNKRYHFRVGLSRFRQAVEEFREDFLLHTSW